MTTTRPLIALAAPAALFTLTGCPRPEPVECGEFEQVFVYEDADGDSFGTDAPIGYVCQPGPNQSTNTVDCDDERADVNPTAEEVCDDADNDCNGAVDERSPKLPYYRDQDGDGYGSTAPRDRVTACEAPDGYIDVSGDCDDDDDAVNPAAHEICNDGLDDDCDGAADDEDGSVDPSTQERYYLDNDLDGYGDEGTFADLCLAPVGGVLLGGDCDDDRATTNPSATEACNGLDDDCDQLVDMDDPSLPPEALTTFYQDADHDGYGNPDTEQFTCNPNPPGVLVGNDCDDTDPTILGLRDWYSDGDGDGWGGTFVVTACADPGGLYSEEEGVDCDDGDSTIYPTAVDPCLDGVDQNCTGTDACRSCKQWLDSGMSTGDGAYDIESAQGSVAQIWCDMTTDGGGWTLVASTNGLTLNDEGTSAPYGDLQTLTPNNGHEEVWDGLRDLAPNEGDIRFACKQDVNDAAFEVDLSFYDIHWYSEITRGTDADSCFSETDGIGDDQPTPARRNNLTGVLLNSGDPWSAGYLEGEDSCSDQGDFTVDFDDRGMDSNQSDGTDWGEDDSSFKCGNGLGDAFFIFYREP